MLGQRGTHDLGHRQTAKTSLALRRTEPGHSSEGGGELTVDPHMPAQEVDAIDCEPEAFAMAQSHCRGEDDKGPVTLGDGHHQRLDLADAKRYNLSIRPLRQ